MEENDEPRAGPGIVLLRDAQEVAHALARLEQARRAGLHLRGRIDLGWFVVLGRGLRRNANERERQHDQSAGIHDGIGMRRRADGKQFSPLSR